MVIRDFGDGLILRQATLDDTDALVDFNSRVHSDAGWDKPDTRAGVWVRDLMTKPHPTFTVGDFLVVENTATGTIVSSTCLISQTWSYSGITFGVGRPELVGTHADYRNRGLIRAQFEVLHQWSEERGHKMQGITGIPYYYRQFGYEMAMDMHGARKGPLSSVPQLEKDETEPYRVRPAEATDLDFVAEVAAYAQQRYLVSCVRDSAQWRYEFDGRSQDNALARRLCTIESMTGERVGYLHHPYCLWYDALYMEVYELKPGVSWWAVTPSVMRYLQTTGQEYKPYLEVDEKKDFESITFGLGCTHPVYQIVENWLPKINPPYAWYIRVPDVADFLRTITPVLEKRLAQSVMVGYTGELKLNFYRDGVKMKFDKGTITEIVLWEFPGYEWKSAKFPDLTFLQLLFGYRSLEELKAAYPDCGSQHEFELLLKSLFPKQPSVVWPIS
ncbi:MAG: GNAT family N-acetyltransferase [Anaerolineae bacterium]|nr:GNAT family N-acetyltransferase [Anaerolineae bacterium]